MSKRGTIIKIVATLVVATIFISIYLIFNPAEQTLFPKCVLKMLTGYDCPGCGSQRAIHALLHGDIAAAWHYNAMLLISLPPLAVLFVAEALRCRHPRFYTRVNSPTVVIAVVAIILAWWIGRNIFCPLS